jgi:hypothetical protein
MCKGNIESIECKGNEMAQFVDPALAKTTVVASKDELRMT